MNKQYLVFLVAFFISAGSALGEDDVPSSQQSVSQPWDVSGYISLVAKRPDNNQPSEIELDDLSIFLSKNFNKWLNPFVEAEIFGAPLWKSQGKAQLKDGGFIFERLYNDFNLDSETRLRVGKFLAPVGQWNLIHAAPLVWTVERPLTTTFSYSNYITGVEYGKSINAISGSRFDIYFQGSNDFDPKPLKNHPRLYSQVFGGSWTLIDDLDTRSSVDIQYAEVRTNNTERTTVSWQKVWYLSQWDIDSQLIYTRVVGDEARRLQTPLKDTGWDGGGFMQARYRLTPHWNLYGRGEYFHFADNNQSGNIYLLGARYRFDKMGNLNFEYRSGSGAKRLEGKSISVSYNAMIRW